MTNPMEKLRRLLASSTGSAKQLLLRDIHEAILDAETPQETATRLSLYPLQMTAARIGQDLKIFEILEDGPKTLGELEQRTGAHPAILGRMLRYMASIGMVKESSADHFETSRKCSKLADPAAETIVTHFYENCAPLWLEMPAFLRQNKYQDITDGKATIFQPAYKTDLDTYAWFAGHPEHRSALIKYMGMEQAVRGLWLKAYPFERETNGWDTKDPVFVDVGGNVGHYCALFKTEFPHIPGRVVLQDLPSTIAHAVATPGVEIMGHDFFQEQPIKGAKYYHLGWILHNWNDEKSKEILRQITVAMASESKLLINDMVLPDAGVPMYSAAMDLVMLGACASKERRRSEWDDLLGEVGLVIDDCIVYDVARSHGIISAVLE